MIELELRSSTDTGGRFVLSLPTVIKAYADGYAARSVSNPNTWEQIRTSGGTISSTLLARVKIEAATE